MTCIQPIKPQTAQIIIAGQGIEQATAHIWARISAIETLRDHAAIHRAEIYVQGYAQGLAQVGAINHCDLEEIYISLDAAGMAAREHARGWRHAFRAWWRR